MIVKDGQCVNWQRYQIRDGVKRIPYWESDHVGREIVKKFAKDGGDKSLVNMALKGLGLQTIK